MAQKGKPRALKSSYSELLNVGRTLPVVHIESRDHFKIVGTNKLGKNEQKLGCDLQMQAINENKCERKAEKGSNRVLTGSHDVDMVKVTNRDQAKNHLWKGKMKSIPIGLMHIGNSKYRKEKTVDKAINTSIEQTTDGEIEERAINRKRVHQNQTSKVHKGLFHLTHSRLLQKWIDEKNGRRLEDVAETSDTASDGGLHHRLNTKAGGVGLPFYRLVPVLRNEAVAVEQHAQLVRDGVAGRRIRKSYQKVQKAIRKLWEQYDENLITTSELLKRCGKVYSPSFQVEDSDVNGQ